jgi:xylan 1,4-beta-xylosidase
MSRRYIENPILKGFHPDPSFIRVGEDYYIASSTFEWFPAIRLHHSRDLLHWKLIGHVLTEKSQLDLTGVPNSGGIWAPSMSYCDGLFYMMYTVVRTKSGPFKDLKNYLVTAKNIIGPWSAPIFLNASGFDASLFHDEDGRKWVVNMQWDYRKDKSHFEGIVLQEYSPVQKKLVGSPKMILQKKILIEGPNLYKINGYYYLMIAQGGTGWQHSIAMARSKHIEGPYELDPQEVILTSKYDSKLELQKAGHGELVQTQDGQWYLAHLCSRPVGDNRRCILGRETAIQKCIWSNDGWLRLHTGQIEPQVKVPAPDIPTVEKPAPPLFKDNFDEGMLNSDWSTLREPADASWLSLTERKSWVRIFGRESLHSLFEQSLIARRLQSFRVTAQTCMQFKPTHYGHTAGLVCWYDTDNHYYLRVSYDNEKGIVLGIVLTDDGKYDELTDCEIAIEDRETIYLKVEIDYETLQYFYSTDGVSWKKIGPVLDAAKLSDDYADKLKFTGAFVGLCVQDLQGTGIHADFDYFCLEQKS